MKNQTILRHAKPRSKGFTVIEALIALFVLAVGLLSFAALVPTLKSDVTRSDHRTRAVFLAQRSVEWLHALQYDDPLLGLGTHSDPSFSVPGYTRSWQVEGEVPIPNVKRVTVTVIRTDDDTESATMVFLHGEVGR